MMVEKTHLEDMVQTIQNMRTDAERLKKAGAGIEAIERNVIRILSSIRLLELNITDVVKTMD